MSLSTPIKEDRLRVAIYRERLLPVSETFILSQGESLSHFLAFYFGLRRDVGLEVRTDRSFVLNSGGALGRLREAGFKLFSESARLEAAIMEIRPVLLHAHFGQDASQIAPIAKRLHLPLVVTFHGWDINQSDDWLRRNRKGRCYLRDRESLKRAACIILANSRFTHQRLLEKGFPPDKIRLHYIGADTNVFRPDRSVKRRPLVLFVGRLVPNKGCEFLIRAMAEVQQAHPDVGLVIIGDGAQRQSLRKLAAGTLRDCQFLGKQSPGAVLHWMRQAQVFCVPSVTIATGESEAFGIVFAEAQATGLPVVSFATGGIPEAVADGETGLLAPEKDWRKLAQNILILLRSEATWQSMSEAGQQRVRREFDLHKQCTALERIYQEIATLPYRGL